jgi:hypothetical protein
MGNRDRAIELGARLRRGDVAAVRELVEALDGAGGHVAGAARLLGVPLRTLQDWQSHVPTVRGAIAGVRARLAGAVAASCARESQPGEPVPALPDAPEGRR